MKKWLRRGACTALAAVMTFGLAGCGREAKGTMSTDPNLAKQYVYACQDVKLTDAGDNYSIQTGAYKDGRIYLAASIYQYDENGSSQLVKLYSMKEDGSDLQVTDFQLPEGTDRPDDQEDGGDAEAAKPEGADTNTADVAADTAEADVDAEIDKFPADAPSFYENIYYNNLIITDEDIVYGRKTYYYEDYSDPENYISKNEDSILKWDMEGNLLAEYPLPVINSQEEYLYLNNVVSMGDGTVAVLYTGDSIQMCTVDADGNVSERAPLPETASIMQNSSGIMVKGNGELLVTYYDENDWAKMYVATYDLKTNTASEGVELPTSFMMTGYSAMLPGITTDLVYADNNGVHTINVGDTQSKQMMSFVNSDLSISNMQNLILLDENRFVGVYNDSVTWEPVVGIFTKVNPEDIPDKKTLLMAGNWIGSDVKQQVIKFNKASDEYRIILKEYNSYNTMDDYYAGIKQLNNDIISGNMPDILMVDQQLPLANYISKGLIADVNDLLAKDEELSKVEFMPNVFEAYSVKGKLYQVIPSFNVMTMVAKESKVGDKTAWTMKDMQEVMKSMPEGAVAMSDMARGYFLTMMMQYCGSDFVDVSAGKCHFNTQNFIDMLEFAKTLPAELGDDYYGDSYWENYESQYREDRTLLAYTYISNVRDMNRVMNGNFGEPISFVGFPTENGNGSCISMNSETFALSAKSKNLDGAWQFARYYLTDEYQESLTYGMPVSKAVFDKKAAEAMNKPYYIDENGEKVEYEENFYINNESFVLEPMTQEQVDQVVNFVTSVKTKQYYNEEINNIITEEAEAFFSGQKSAQEVAGIIQSRAQIYVSENS